MNIKRFSAGFLLPAFVMYAAIVVMLCAAAFRLTALVVPTAYRLIDWCNATNFYTAHDFMDRELSCAPADSASWLKADSDGLMWRIGTITKAFLIREGALLYKEGSYANGRWAEAKTSLLARDCTFETVQLTAVGDRVKELCCKAQYKSIATHTWECRQVWHGC